MSAEYKMKIERKKNAFKGVFYGFIGRSYTVIIPFFMRTLLIHRLGIEYAGLNNLFSSIFTFLNLSEFGIGAAVIASMYTPIANDDEGKLCALLNFYRKCLFIIGSIVMVLGMLCIPFLKYLIAGDVPSDINIYVLYVLYLIQTVISYWMFSYKASLFQAFQENYVLNRFQIVAYFVQVVVQLIALLIFHDYYIYIASAIVYQVVLHLGYNYSYNKRFQNYKAKGKLTKEESESIKRKVQGLFAERIGNAVLNNGDTIVISACLGLAVLGKYQNYYFVLSAIMSMIKVFLDSCTAGIGNSLVIEGAEKNYSDFITISFGYFWILSICCNCFLAVFQEFITLWVGQEYLFSYSLVICFVIYFLSCEIDKPLTLYKEAAGVWYEDRYRTIIISLVNLVLNIIMVQFIGLYGVLISTIISLTLIGYPWLIKIVYNMIFVGCNFKTYLYDVLKNIGLCLASCLITVFLIQKINHSGVWAIVLKLLVALIVSNSVLFMAFRKNPNLHRLIGIIWSIWDGKRNKD